MGNGMEARQEMVDVIIHVPSYLLAQVDEKIRRGEFVSRCQLVSRAIRWYLAHLDAMSDDK